MNLSIPIWPAGDERDVFLRLQLRLPEPCRDGEIRCSASGPFQVYLDGARLGGGTGGMMMECPTCETLTLEGAWDSGELELIVVANAGVAGDPWFQCEGGLFVAGKEGETLPIVSGVDWHGRFRRQDSDQRPGFERHMATDAPVAGDCWQGVVIVQDPLEGMHELVGATEFAQSPQTLLDVGSVPTQSAAVTTLQPLGTCKCVHHDALLSGGHGATHVRTSPGQTVQLNFDFGRQLSGWPFLRLRGGRGGVVDMLLSSRRDSVEHTLRYHCGEGRQEMVGLVLARARYVTLQLTGFDDDDLPIEALQFLERHVAETATAQIGIDEGVDAAWIVGAESVHGSRQEVYGYRALPKRYDWLEGWILQSNDLTHTGSPRVARQALLGRGPTAPFEPADWAYALALDDYQQHTLDPGTVEHGVTCLRQMLEHTERLLNEPPSPWSQASFAALALAAIDATIGICEHGKMPQDLEALRETCHQRLESCWNEERGLYAERVDGNQFRQWTNGLALYAVGDEVGRAAQIEQAMRRTGVEAVADLTQAWMVAAGLGRAGRQQRMMDVIHNHWLRRLSREGSTWRDKRGSDAIGIGPGADALWQRYLLGIRPMASGWSIRQLTPPLGLLQRGQAKIPVTTDSFLHLEWAPDRDDEDVGETDVVAAQATRLTLQVDIEGETHLRLERGGRKRPSISVNDEVVWRNEKIYPNPIIHMIHAEADHVVVLFERPGRFTIRLE